MRCPFCAHEDSQVKDSRPSEDGAAIRRRRQCEACGARFTTFERVQLRDLTVVKKNGDREPFERDKLARSIAIACRKRDISPERIDRLVSSIQRQLETRGDDVKASEIGEAVMDGLKAIDHVAYIRFASVYKDFNEPGDFAEIVDAVGEEGRTEEPASGSVKQQGAPDRLL
jgi:transcriptional repressor NrdR